jgi:hypothetical protein
VHAGFLLVLLLSPEDRASKFFWNVRCLLDY